MGIYIGLNSANVTLEAMHYNKSMDVNFNERQEIYFFKIINQFLLYHWFTINIAGGMNIIIFFYFRLNFVRPTELKEEFKAALVKGLPYPILTVAEYMAVDAEGFCWGRNYRQVVFKTIKYGYFYNF